MLPVIITSVLKYVNRVVSGDNTVPSYSTLIENKKVHQVSMRTVDNVTVCNRLSSNSAADETL